MCDELYTVALVGIFGVLEVDEGHCEAEPDVDDFTIGEPRPVRPLSKDQLTMHDE